MRSVNFSAFGEMAPLLLILKSIAQQARQEKIKQRAEVKAKLEEEAKKEAEDDLIKKAIKFKKQQIKKIQIQLPDLDTEEEEENDAPIEKPQVKAPVKAPEKKQEDAKIKPSPLAPAKPKSKYIFV